MFAVKVGAVATPAESVVAIGVDAKEPLGAAPVEGGGGAKVTERPGTGLPNESVAVAFRAVANAVLIGADCGVPAVAVSRNAAPGLFVKLKAAGAPTPGVVALTV